MDESTLRVLLLDDDPVAAEQVLSILRRSRLPPIRAERGCASADSVPDPAVRRFDVVLVDVGDGHAARLSILDQVLGRCGLTPVVALTSVNDLELGDRLVRSGAHGWLVLPGLTGGALRHAVRKAVESTPKEWILAEYVASLGRRDRAPDAAAPASDTADAALVCTAPTLAAAADDLSASIRKYDDVFRGPEAPDVAPSALSPEAASSSPNLRFEGLSVGRRTTTVPPPARGELLDGKYELVRAIAEGGLGQVFEARHVVIGHRVAVKMIRRALSQDPEMSARFLLEARAAGAVEHPGCIKVADFGVSPDGRAYLVMEYLDGENLADRIRRESRLSVAAASDIVWDVLDVLAATHAKGIVHRDLKPENVFLSVRAGYPTQVKLLDFGIARLNQDSPGGERLTSPGVALGSPHFMSPEQVAGRSDVDARADIYSAGAVLFEALTGRTPFKGANAREVMLHVLTESFPSLLSVAPSLPPELEEVMRRATARDRAHRYPSAEAFQLALQPFVTPPGAGTAG